MSYSTQEVKSGVLVTVALVLSLALTFLVGNFSQGPGIIWQVQFGYINGLKKDAPVFFSGHEVGRVKKIDVVAGNERPIFVSIWVPSSIKLRKDTQAYIDTLGLMGEKFVELSSGTPDAPFLVGNSVIAGTDPVPMYLLIQKANRLADRMEEMTNSLNPLMDRINNITSGHEEELAKIITNINEITANLRDMTHDLKYRPWRLLRKG